MPRVDTREDKRRSEPLRRAGWQIATLHYGDYDGHDAVGKLWIVEHKTIGKMVTDMRSGTLIRQCRALVEHSDFPILMVEGHWVLNAQGFLLTSNVTWEQAWNQLQTIQDMGCRLQLTSGLQHTVERLFQLEAYYNKEKHGSTLRQLSGNPYIVVLSQIDGIDQGKAKALEIEFNTLVDVAIASPGQLQGVKGIGEVLAKRIWQFFRMNYMKRNSELWK